MADLLFLYQVLEKLKAGEYAIDQKGGIGLYYNMNNTLVLFNMEHGLLFTDITITLPFKARYEIKVADSIFRKMIRGFRLVHTKYLF